MPATDNGGRRFRLDVSAVVAESMRALFRRAAQAGKGKPVLQAYRRIVQRLEASADSFGEPLYYLTNLQVEVRHAVIGPIAVDYGVMLSRNLVFIKGFRLL
jgi:hypothetical protein